MTGFILSLFVLAAAFLYITWNAYQAIHEKEGIVVSTWWGKQHTLDWALVEAWRLLHMS
ncbi:hypothetical protein M3197_12925 [Sporosarcina aquimarina]|uniref:hypothetical protein n=1 Tax=Sporosarcina aquimarina TaxID=114975 RepID=UPI00203E2D4A|nr:hypothetical protein [Sporosarcina aquimarina]MCM3758366.1 hypothetical protein [Sporosarcina aquimarina]